MAEIALYIHIWANLKLRGIQSVLSSLESRHLCVVDFVSSPRSSTSMSLFAPLKMTVSEPDIETSGVAKTTRTALDLGRCIYYGSDGPLQYNCMKRESET